MMKVLIRLFLLVFLVAGGYYIFQESDLPVREAVNDLKEVIISSDPSSSEESDMFVESNQSSADSEQGPVSSANESDTIDMEANLSSYMGENTEALSQAFGDPVRKDPSSYGYESWIYTDGTNQYIEFGIKDEKVSMVYAAGEEISVAEAQVGQSYETIKNEFALSNELSFSYEGNPYRFQLNEEDIQMRPIVQLDENIFLQLYFDTFENKLSSVRFLNKNVLLAHRPYEIYYRAPLPDQPVLDEEEWRVIQTGMAQQVFELTNVVRHKYGVGALNWDENAAAVALHHSKDMYDNNYFSHYSLNGDGLKERLREYDIQYFSAGENIAAQYTDSPAAVEGWLNSEGHREALLNDQYTHLGVGVYRYFYTQNFLQKS